MTLCGAFSACGNSAGPNKKCSTRRRLGTSAFEDACNNSGLMMSAPPRPSKHNLSPDILRQAKAAPRDRRPSRCEPGTILEHRGPDPTRLDEYERPRASPAAERVQGHEAHLPSRTVRTTMHHLPARGREYASLGEVAPTNYARPTSRT